MTHDRGDSYNSQRDYQTIHEGSPTILSREDGSFTDLSFTSVANQGDSDFIGFGGYLRPGNACEMDIELSPSGFPARSVRIQLSERWNRFGIATEADVPCGITATLLFSQAQVEIEGWGICMNGLSLPQKVLREDPNGEDLSKDHLAPETFYLPTDQQPFSELDGVGWNKRDSNSSSGTIFVKKCAYCQRYLPLTPESPGGLAFHKHSDKVTDHQNECRACKKWRINNELNDLRTPDQFHESSTINRERRLLLREPEVLEHIKDKYNQGLKSLVWERFNHKCFRCGQELDHDEVQVDHTRPLAYLWPIDEHATCLCATCNNHKKDKFPVDFYTSNQLESLSEITGLPIGDLKVKDVNPSQLRRIKSNIEQFAAEWSPMTLQAINRKVVEMRPDEDLLELLRQRNSALYQEVARKLDEAREW